MNKPITVVREEIKDKIAEVINSSGLPAFVIEPILNDFLIEVKNVVKHQYEYDKQQYEMALKNENDKKEKSKEK